MSSEGKNRGTYVVGYCHPYDVAHSFLNSLMGLRDHDLVNRRRLRGRIAEECGASRLIDGRNRIVRKFLQTDAEWLFMVDADMSFEPDLPDRLIDAADRYERPIVGALAFAQKYVRETVDGGRMMAAVPTLYRWFETDQVCGVAPIWLYPRNQLVQVDATGAACFIVHRRVLENVALPGHRPWFDDTQYKDQVLGEDITFFRRCAEAGYPIYVHTGIRTSHLKHHYLNETTVDMAGTLKVPTWVVVPMKNRHDLTAQLLDDLSGHDRVLLFDNGSDDPETRAWLDGLDRPDVTVVDADGWTLHQMWNAGLNIAQQSSGARFNVAILNNDIRVEPDTLPRLAHALRADPMVAAVSPNYDGRDGDPIQYTDDICAGRYDGTGGLAGFAFMLKGEQGYRFPEELSWWYGDSDLVTSVTVAGFHCAIVRDARCVHVDGGSQTGDWSDPDMQKLLAADRATFRARWSGQLAESA